MRGSQSGWSIGAFKSGAGIVNEFTDHERFDRVIPHREKLLPLIFPTVEGDQTLDIAPEGDRRSGKGSARFCFGFAIDELNFRPNQSIFFAFFQRNRPPFCDLPIVIFHDLPQGSLQREGIPIVTRGQVAVGHLQSAIVIWRVAIGKTERLSLRFQFPVAWHFHMNGSPPHDEEVIALGRFPIVVGIEVDRFFEPFEIVGF